MLLTLPLRKVALACNSCIGWVGGAGNLIPVPAVNSLRTGLAKFTQFDTLYVILLNIHKRLPK